MGYLLSFLPWIVFAVVSGVAWQWAALLALAISAWFVVRNHRAGIPADAQILGFGTIVFFAALRGVHLLRSRDDADRLRADLTRNSHVHPHALPCLLRLPTGRHQRRAVPRVGLHPAIRLLQRHSSRNASRVRPVGRR